MLRSWSLLLLLTSFALCSTSSSEEGKNTTERHDHSHHRSGRHGHFHRHQPEFLKDVTKAQKKEYFKIVFDRNSTRAQIKKNVAEWAKKSGVEKQLADHNEKRELFFAEHNKNVTEAISKLAEAQKNILSILKDESLTHKQSWQKINELTKDYSPQLKSLVFALKPHRGGHRGFGGNKGGKKEEKKEEDKENEKQSEEKITLKSEEDEQSV